MIVVLSMHRSGSSLLTSLLKDRGFSLGEDSLLIPADKNNKKGYFERSDIVALNEGLLKFDGYNSSFPDLCRIPSISTGKEKEISKIVESLEDKGVEIIKDPRFCLTLPVWLPFFSDVKIVFLYRNPLDVAESYVRRQRYTFQGGLALWEYYNIRALNCAANLPTSFIGFDELVRDGDLSVSRVINELGLDRKSLINNASTRMDESLIHGATKNRNLELMTASQIKLFETLSNSQLPSSEIKLPRSLVQTFSLLREFVESGYEPSTGRLLDRKTEEKLTDIVARNSKLREESKNIREERKNLREAINAIKKENKSVSDELQSLKNKNINIKNSLERVSEENREFQKQLKLVRADKDELSMKLKLLSSTYEGLKVHSISIENLSRRLLKSRLFVPSRMLFNSVAFLFPNKKPKSILLKLESKLNNENAR